MAYATVTLTGKISFGLEPAVGRAILTPTVNLVSDLDGNVVIYGPIIGLLDATGAFSINAPANDDPNLNPQNFGYTLRFELERGTIPAIPEFGLPAAASPVDLTDILPDPQNPTYVPTLSGPPNELVVGTVTAVDYGVAPQIDIVGEPPLQTINFILPRGPQGIQGIQGQQGIQGIQGIQGVPGGEAYVGTEEPAPELIVPGRFWYDPDDDLGAYETDLDILETQYLEVPIHQRSVTLAYTSGKLTTVTEKSGATTLKTTTLNYTGDNLTSTVEVVGGRTITTTLAYTGSDLTSVTRVVA